MTDCSPTLTLRLRIDHWESVCSPSKLSCAVLQLFAFFARVFVSVCVARQCLRRLLAAGVNDRALYRDLIAAPESCSHPPPVSCQQQPSIKTRPHPTPQKNNTPQLPFLPLFKFPLLLIPLLFLAKCIYLSPRAAPSPLRIFALISLGTLRQQHSQALCSPSQKRSARGGASRGIIPRGLPGNVWVL